MFSNLASYVTYAAALRTMKLLMGSRVGWPAGLPGHVLGAGLGQPNCACASSAVSSSPSFGSEQPFCISAGYRKKER